MQMLRSKAQEALCLGGSAEAPCPHLFLTICSRAEGLLFCPSPKPSNCCTSVEGGGVGVQNRGTAL